MASSAARPRTPAREAPGTPAARSVHRRGQERAAPARLRLVGYVRVSTREQGSNGHGLDAQRSAIERYCRANGYALVTIIPDVMTTRSIDKLYGRSAAVAAVEAGLADGLLISTLDRATRSTLDGAVLLDQARRKGWRLLSVDGIDSDNEQQALLTDIRIAVAAEERRKISERTKAGLEAAREKGKVIGRPRSVTAAVVRRIVRMRTRDGLSANAIALALDKAKVPPPGNGARWHHSTVRAVLAREGTA